MEIKSETRLDVARNRAKTEVEAFQEMVNETYPPGYKFVTKWGSHGQFELEVESWNFACGDRLNPPVRVKVVEIIEPYIPRRIGDHLEDVYFNDVHCPHDDYPNRPQIFSKEACPDCSGKKSGLEKCPTCEGKGTLRHYRAYSDDEMTLFKKLITIKTPFELKNVNNGNVAVVKGFSFGPYSMDPQFSVIYFEDDTHLHMQDVVQAYELVDENNQGHQFSYSNLELTFNPKPGSRVLWRKEYTGNNVRCAKYFPGVVKKINPKSIGISIVDENGEIKNIRVQTRELYVRKVYTSEEIEQFKNIEKSE